MDKVPKVGRSRQDTMYAVKPLKRNSQEGSFIYCQNSN